MPELSAPPLRIIKEHQINDCNNAIEVHALDQPQSGVHHHYAIVKATPDLPPETLCEIKFQIGLFEEVGVNGATNEALLAVVLDRLHAFQGNKWSRGRETAKAISRIEEALLWLLQRTRKRQLRGIKSTGKK